MIAREISCSEFIYLFLFCSFILIQFGCPNLIRMCQMLCLLSITKFNKICSLFLLFFIIHVTIVIFIIWVFWFRRKKSVVSLINNTYQCADVISSCSFFLFWNINSNVGGFYCVLIGVFESIFINQLFVTDTQTHIHTHTHTRKYTK